MVIVVEFLLSGFTDNSGEPLSLGRVETYLAGTTTPKAVYVDNLGTIPETNPVILDSNGRKKIYADGSYKFIVKSAAGIPLYTFDNLFFGVGSEVAGVTPASATLGLNLIANGSFVSGLLGWSYGGGSDWSIVSGAAKHATGNTTALSQSISVVSGATYLLIYTLSGAMAGNLVASINGTTITTYNSIETDVPTTVRGSYLATTTGLVTFALTPTSAFDSSVDNISIQAVTAAGTIVTYTDADSSTLAEIRGDDSQNTLGIGLDSLRLNTGDLLGYGVDNVAFGDSALAKNISGYTNTGIGSHALSSNGTGYANTALGADALASNTSGFVNTAIGNGALKSNTYGAYNIAIGSNAMYERTFGISSIAIGSGALFHNNGNYNIAIGGAVLGASGDVGSYNHVVGVSAAQNNTSGRYLQGLGFGVLQNNTTGEYNDAFGHQALKNNTTGSRNAAFGGQTLGQVIGSDNCAFGAQAGSNQTAGSGNIVIGSAQQLPSLTASNQLNIGGTIYGDLANDRIGIGVTNPSSTLEVGGDLRCDAIANDTGLAAGVYTPTLFNVANLDASTAYQCQYLRVGNTVTVSGRVDVDPTLAVTATQLGISLPIASAFTTANQCAGCAASSSISGQSAAILSDATNDRAEMKWKSSDITNQDMYFTFSYQVI